MMISHAILSELGVFQTPKTATASPALSDMDRKRPQSSSPTSEAAKRPKVAAAPSPPKERRKKSLPVRKLLEMERSQGNENYRREKVNDIKMPRKSIN